MYARVLVATWIVAVASCGDDDAHEPLVCPEQADGTCAPDAPEGCWTWSSHRVREGESCHEAIFSVCTSGGVDAGAAETCWQVTYPDGGTARYVTADTSHRFPSDWSATHIDDGTCDGLPTDACGP